MYSLYVFHFHGSQNRYGSGAVKTQSGNKTATAHISDLMQRWQSIRKKAAGKLKDVQQKAGSQ